MSPPPGDATSPPEEGAARRDAPESRYDARGPRVLVVGPAWIGDMVMAQSLFRLLRHRDPEVQIDVLAPDWSRSIVRRMPEVSDVIELPIGHGELRLGLRWRIARRLRSRGYDRAIVTKRSLKSALIPWMAGIPRRTGILGELRYGLLNDIRSLDDEEIPLTAHRYAALGLEAGEELDPDAVEGPRFRVDEESQERRMRELGLEGEGSGPILAMAPGAAYGSSKRWPLERWGRLAAKLAERGWRSWVFGGDDEREAGAAIREAGGDGVRDLTGRTSLTDVVDLMDRCRAVVTNDSGLMHVASGLDVHVVALFGSTSPRRTPPLTARRTVLWLDLECSPCFERTCPLEHHDCLREIGVEEVRETVLGGDGSEDEPSRPGAGIPTTERDER